MSCEDVNASLAQNGPLSADALDHLERCPNCRALASSVAAINRLKEPGKAPDPKLLGRISEQIRGSLTPVRALPSDGRMLGFALFVFVAFSLAFAAPFGYHGLNRMNAMERICYYALMIVLAVLFSSATIQQIVPGSRKQWHPLTMLLLSGISVSVLVFVLFGAGDQSGFVHFGTPCLGVGLFSATLGGLLGFLLVRKGYSVRPVEAGTMTGSLAGLAGVSVLALHCSRLGALHIIVWHLGALLIAAIAGTVFAKCWPTEWRPVKRR